MSQEHVKINGVWYALAEDAEGTHYAMNLEPLRLPNSQVVQGGSGDFQLRDDQLLWTLTDWSGGEGQLKWDAQEPSRSYLLQGVDPFTRPGNLTIGFLEELAALQTGGDFTDDGIRLGLGKNTVWAIPDDDHIAYEWDSDQAYFKTAITPSQGAGGVLGDTICGDFLNMYFVDNNGEIIRYTGAWTKHNDQITSGVGTMVQLANFLYFLSVQDGKLFELSSVTANTSTAETPLYEFSGGQPQLTGSNLVAGDNRVYFYTNKGFTTVIHEVVPTTAAGTGYGRILAEIEGILCEAIWFQGGILYFLGVDQAPGTGTVVGPNRFIMYLQPDGKYGTLGSVRGLVRAPSDHGIAGAHGQGAVGGIAATSGRLTRTAFLVPPTSEDQDKDDVAQGIFEIDGTTGGYAAVARYPTTVTTRPTDERGLIYFDGKYLAFDDDLNKVHTWDVSRHSNQVGEFVSPSHDMGLSSEKILERIEVVCEPLPANTSISVGFSLDGATWVDATIATGTGTIGGVLQISTDSSTKKFRSLQIRGQLTPASAESPELKAVNIYSRVNRRVKVWDLILDVTDDAAPAGYDGAQLIANIVGLADNTVIDFVDKYQSHNPENAGTQFDAVLDAGVVVLSQPGEGMLAVKITEVI